MKTAQLINTVLVAALAGVWAFWSFASHGTQSQMSQMEWEFSHDLAWEETVTVLETTTVRRNGRDALVLFPDTSANLFWDEVEHEMTVELLEGDVLFTTLADDLSVSVVTDFAAVRSEGGLAHVALSEEVLELSAITHASRLEFLRLGAQLNARSVPAGYRVSVSADEVTDTLARLRLTKLSKEFPAFTLSDEDLDEAVWQAVDAVEDAYQDTAVDFLTEAQRNSDFGPDQGGLSAQLASVLDAFQARLTVLPHAVDRMNREDEVDALRYAMTHLLFGDVAQGEDWVAQWQATAQNNEEVQDLYSSLFFALPGDELYPLKAAAADVLFADENVMSSLQQQYREIERLLAGASQIEAEEAYEAYQAEFQDALESGAFDDVAWLESISREYVLLELLLRSHATFYTVEAVSLLGDVEAQILALAGTSDLDEERQAFVLSKLRFLENLFEFVVQRQLSVSSATQVANELLFSAEAYLNAIGSQVAVRDYFESRLEEYDLAIQFMNSPEFYTYGDFDRGLEAYRDKVDDLDDLNAYLQTLRSSVVDGDEAPSVNEAALIAAIEEDLLMAGIQYAEVVSLGDSGFRLFELQGARTGGYAFEANFDRETQILYDVVVGEVRFSTGLLLETAQEVIVQAVEGSVEEELAENAGGNVADDGERSFTESVALTEAEAAFDAAGLDADAFNFEVVDVEANLFYFEGVATRYDLPISGNFDLEASRVSEVTWEGQGATRSLPDLDLEQLAPALEATYEALT